MWVGGSAVEKHLGVIGADPREFGTVSGTAELQGVFEMLNRQIQIPNALSQ